jgi:cellulose biosynthesis protein BcsQ
VEKLTVVFVDSDENYLMALEKKFVEELGGYINISIITDMYYFGEYFSTPRNIDILVINEQVYNASIEQHKIKHIYILTENPEMTEENLIYNVIYKYTSVVEIYEHIVSNDTLRVYAQSTSLGNGGIISIYSPCGGCGKTTLALGMALALVKQGRRVLFISTESMQAFGYYLNEESVLGTEFKSKLAYDNNLLKDNIGEYIKKGIFDYLPPWGDILVKAGVSKKDYIKIIEAVKLTAQYDYIVIDVDSALDEDTYKLLDISDKVITIATQDKIAAIKVDKFVSSLSEKNNEKYYFICNRYEDNRENYLLNYINSFYVREYIYADSSLINSTITEMLQNIEIGKLANIF